MKAIRFEQYGEPAQVLTVQQCPQPQPGKGEVRGVRMLASPITPSALLFVRGHHAGVHPHFPSLKEEGRSISQNSTLSVSTEMRKSLHCSSS